MPDARITVEHSKNRLGGLSSYVHVILYRGHDCLMCRKARISDHGIGERRYYSDADVLYLAEGARAGAWELWLAKTVAEYQKLGGRIPAVEGLFAA